MSDELDLRRTWEKELGRALTEEEEVLLRDCERKLAEIFEEVKANAAAMQWAAAAAPYLELMQRLTTRQGSRIPDFDELYRRKAELERCHDRPLAQFKVGDLIVVIENADVKVENEVIHQVFKGATFAVVKSEGDLLWVDASIPGWIPAGNVVPLDKAAAHFTEVIRKSPDEPRNYLHRAAVWQACHEYDRAIGDYDEAIKLDPSWHGLYSGRGWCLLAKKQYDEAIADFSKSITMEANNMVAFNRRGGAYALTGDYEKAIADYEVAIQLAPKVISARANLAELLACCPEAKWRAGKKAVELAKGLCDETKWLDSERIHYLACAYAETGDFDSAIRREKLAIELNPPERRKALTNFRKALDLFEAHQPSHGFMIFD